MGTGLLKITAGRHPCVELMDGVEFIANDCVLDHNAANFQIITGPNMVLTNNTLFISDYQERILMLFYRAVNRHIFEVLAAFR